MNDNQLDYYAPENRNEDDEADYMQNFPIELIDDDEWDFIGY